MSYVMARFYDWIMAGTEAACLAEWRRTLLADVDGVVVELGAGTGANLRWYPPQVTALSAVEPDPHMAQRLRERASEFTGVLTVHEASAEHLPFESASVDVVVMTLVCCTVPSPDLLLAEAFRVLRPGGRLLFIEHVAAAEGSDRLVWQKRIEPLWRVVAGGCHLTRRTAEAILAAGFSFDALTEASLRRALPFVRPSVRGIAVKPS